MNAAFFRRLAQVAAEQTLPKFRRSVGVDNKLSIGFDPVTEADKQAELAIVAQISATYPSHGILGEEHGRRAGDGRYVWVIDPIDGTRAFISGLPVWGTLVGLTDDGEAIAGMMSQPFTRELFYADGSGAFYEGPEGKNRLFTRDVDDLSKATMFTTSPALFFGEKRLILDRFERAVQLTRYGVDCYAFAMLAMGSVDLVIEAGLQPYDIVALIPIIEQAGGVITTFDGGPAESGGDIIAAGSQTLHRQAMSLIAAG